MNNARTHIFPQALLREELTTETGENIADVGERGHGGLHHAEVHGRAYAWTDDHSPELAIDLYRP